MSETFDKLQRPRAEGPWADLALHSIGWKAFQDLCSQVSEVVFERPVQIYREAQDGGQDAVFISKGSDGSIDATIQCKHSVIERRKLKLSDLADEMRSVASLVTSGQAERYILMTSMHVDAPEASRIRDALRG